MYLFFDTETTGLPKNWRAPVSDVDNWPRLVQLAWQIYDKEGNNLSKHDFIIKPEGFTIPSEASSVHGISTERAMSEGHDLKEILQQFAKSIEPAETLVAHNMSFDEKIAGAEFLRTGIKQIFFTQQKCAQKTPQPITVKSPDLTDTNGQNYLNYILSYLEKISMKPMTHQWMWKHACDAFLNLRSWG